jgi:hypothetical protein
MRTLRRKPRALKRRIATRELRRSWLSRELLENLESRLLLSVNVLNYHNDISATGANLLETILTPANVNISSFGRKFSTQLDGNVYGQPLVISGVPIAAGVNTTPGAAGVYDVVVAVTQNNSAYAIDGATGLILWKRAFSSTTDSGGNINNPLGATSVTALTAGDVGSFDISPIIGITSTPVADAGAGIVYMVTKTSELVGGVRHFVQRLHAIRLSDGTDAVTPYTIGDTTAAGNDTQIYVYGTGDGNMIDPYNGTGEKVVQFNALTENQRSALSLVNGIVYVAWASHGDNGPYHGWVAAWDVSQLSTAGIVLKGVLNTSPNDGLSGIWEGGGGLVFEPGGNAFYFTTGNGSGGAPQIGPDGFPSDGNYNEALVKAVLDPTSTPTNQNINGWGIKVVDFFIPYDVVALDSADSDFGSGAPVLLPDSAGIPGHPHLMVVGGKSGVLYVIDRDDLGGYNPFHDEVVNAVVNPSGHTTAPNVVSGLLSTPVYYNGKLYVVSGYNGPAYAFTMNSMGILTPSSVTAITGFGYLPGTPSLSANAGTNGILWLMDRAGNKIRAYDANSLSTELWNSGQAPGGVDNLGAVIKFAPPTIANGSVYVGTVDSLVGYGLKAPADAAPLAPVIIESAALSATAVNLKWSDATLQPNIATSYIIESSTDNAAFTQIGVAAASARAISIGGLSGSTTYYFRIRGINPVGTSLDSNTVIVTTNAQTSAIDFSTGFGDSAASLLHLNGAARLQDGMLFLTTNQPNQRASAWSLTQVDITQFSTEFDFTLNGTWPLGSGFTFALHRDTPTSLGIGGSGLGYGAAAPGGNGGIPSSVAVKFAYDTGLFINGAAPIGNTIDLVGGGINILTSYNPMHASMTYNGTTLTVCITDLATHDSATQSYAVNIPAILGGGSAWVGFTGGTGALFANEIIQAWEFHSSSPASPSTSPNEPLGLGATPATATSVNLNWTPSSTNQSGYHLDRATDADFTQNLVTQTLPANPPQFIDSVTGIAPGGTYYYRLRAFNSAGDSGYSNSASVLIPLAPPRPSGQEVDEVTSTSIRFHWTDNAGHAADSYNILRSANHGSFTVIATLPPTSRTAPSVYEWEDANLTPGTFYEYHIVAFNTSGYNDFAGLNATTLPGMPAGLAAAAGNQSVVLSWQAAAGAGTYTVERSTISGGPYVQIAEDIDALTFTDTTVANGTTYYYIVHAKGESGDGPPSAQVSAAPSASTVTIDFPGGFAAAAGSLQLNGSARYINNRLLLTDNHMSQNSSAYALQQQNISSFATQFDFQVDGTWPLADGFTFVIQRASLTALGVGGGGLGYGASSIGGSGGIPSSAALKFDFFSNQGEGSNSTGLYLNGAAPTSLGSINLDGSGFNMRSYNPSRATIVYDGATLAVTIKDLVTHATVTQRYSVNIPAVIGGSNAWVGFTASSGSIPSNNAILNWTFTTTSPAPSTPPAAPAGLTATPGDGQVTLSWNAVASATSYTVRYGTASGVYVQTLPAASTSATVTGLANGTPYFFVVSASNASGPGSNSAEASSTPAATSLPVPAAPTGLAATPGNGQVSLSWNSVATAMSYTVKYGTATGVYTQTLPAASNSATVTGLTNGTPYFFVVTASNGSGPSGNSAEVPATPAAPSPSGGIQFPTGFAGSAALLKLNGSAKLPGSDLILTDGLTSQVSSVYALEQQNIASFSTQFDFQITGTWPLGDGFTFVIQRSSLSAIGQGGGGLGYGAASTGGSGGIASSIAIKFDVYSNQGEGTNSTGLYLNGAAPTLNGVDIGLGGFNMRSYNLSRATMTYDGTTLTVTLKDLLTGATATQNYNVNIPAVIGGSAAWIGFTAASGALTSVSRISNWVFTGAPISPPAAPTGVLATPGNEQVALSWSTVPGATSYTVRYGGTPGVYDQTLAASGSSATITGLTNGTPYYFIVVAANASGPSPDSAEVTATPALALPAAPTGLSATAGSGQVSLAWNPVAGATSYTVRYGTASGVMTTTVPVSITGSSHTVSGLSNGVTYYFVVSASNAAGNGPDSAQASARPGAAMTTIKYPSGFGAASSVFLLNGSARILASGALALTDNHTSQAGSAYFASQQNVSAFATQFDFLTTGSWPLGEGFTFVIQRAAANAIGRDGGGLGYGAASAGGAGGIANSIAIKFDVASNQGEGGNSTGLYLNGAAPTGAGSINLDGTGFNLRSYNLSRAAITYDGATLTVVLTDLVTGATATQSYNVNIPAVIGGSTAWVGFTASTGSQIANHTILNWTFAS